MAKDTLSIEGVPLQPAGMNDNTPLDSENNWYQTRGVNSLSEQCLQRIEGKSLVRKFNSPILAIHGSIKDNIFVETSNTLYLFKNGFSETPEPPEEDVMDYILMRDEKDSGTQGGTFSSGGYQDRTLNTLVTNEGSHAALDSNIITLQPGTYYCRIICPAGQVNRHRAKLRNITDSVDTILGTNAYSVDADNMTCSEIIGSFTIATAKDFKVQHRCLSEAIGSGFGVFVDDGLTEVYTVAEFWWKA